MLVFFAAILASPAAFAGLRGAPPADDAHIDVKRSTIRIHVGKAGLFSAAGHEHWVTAPIADGSIDEGEGRIFFVVQASRVTVEPDKDLKPEQQMEVQRTMQDKVLESTRYPEISFRSSAIEKTGADNWVAKGDLTLHGQTRPVSAAVHKQEGAYVGICRFKQTTFGIHPVSVGGVVKVKDELEIRFSIVRASVAAQ